MMYYYGFNYLQVYKVVQMFTSTNSNIKMQIADE